MKQIVVIHGGNAYDNYKQYMDDLRNKQVKATDFKTRKKWYSWIEKKLEKEFEYFAPQMPNNKNSHYEEWKIWFEKLIPFLKNDVTLIGMSLGGIFLAKYLSENTFPKRIKKLILIAAPFDMENLDEPLGDFKLGKDLSKIALQAKNITLFQSEDDPVVPFTSVFKYQKALPKAALIMLKDRGHFWQETFPELYKVIKA